MEETMTNLTMWEYRYRTYDRANAKANSAARKAMWNANANIHQQIVYGKAFPWMNDLQTQLYGEYLAYRALAMDVMSTM
jgi:hypothetical protein